MVYLNNHKVPDKYKYQTDNIIIIIFKIKQYLDKNQTGDVCGVCVYIPHLEYY